MSRMIEREAAQTLRDLWKEYVVTLVSGPRQSGKTTLTRACFPKADYVLLEDEEERMFALDDPKGFLRRLKGTVIIDEVQYAPGLLSHLLGIVDDPNDHRRFILTGSQNILLSKHVSQSLAGRVGLLTLLPLSLSELRSAHLLKSKSAEDIVFRGLHPRLQMEDIDPLRYAQGYEKTYVERDIRTMGGVGDLLTFQRFLRLCATRVGQLLNYSNLASDCGISQPTAKSWLSILKESYIITLLTPHHAQFSRRMIKSPKLYFTDTNLVCALLQISSSELLTTHPMRGALFENLVIMEYVKHFSGKGLEPPLSFFRDRTGHEIDLLVETGTHVLPIEIKASYSLPGDALKHLNFFFDLPKQKNTHGALVYCGARAEHRGNVQIVPWDAEYPYARFSTPSK